MNYEISTRSATKRKFLDFLMKSYIAQLKLENSSHSIAISLQPDAQDEGLEGCAVPIPGLNMTFVVLSSKASLVDMGRTLAHEMIHVKQSAKGQLKTNSRGYTWRGKRYRASTPYLQRPWEIEAFSRQELLLRCALVDKI